ncbi:MAG: CRISPR-associated endonuclease Cas2 [Candidatus Azambacteria bacterium]|nr:CRISPR-associated endonuclease Cas2 [Candidatus Azambacteria bacterium]
MITKEICDDQIMLRGKSLTREILFMAAAGPLILSSLFLPNAAQILKPLIKWRKNWNKIDRYSIHNAIRRLNQKRLVELIEKNNQLYMEITNNGKKLIKNFDYNDLELPKFKKWDKKWHLVIFDIPEKKSKERRAFSKKLKDMGLYPIQESVFIYPYDCRNEIDFICEFLSISRFINYCVVESLDKKEGDLRKFFGLKLS